MGTSAEKRRDTIGWLKKDVQGERDVEALIAALRHQRRGGARRRSSSIEQVSAELALRGAEAVEPLLRQLEQIGTPACVALANIGAPALGPVTRQLATGSVERRRLLVRTLGLMGSRATVAPLRAALDDPDPEVARAAALALERHAKINVRRLADGGERDEAMGTLEAIGEPAVWPLANALRDVRLGLFAARVLGRIGPAAVKPVMIVFLESRRGLSEGGPSFSYAAAALKDIGAAALDPLFYLLYDRAETASVRLGAGRALGMLRDVAVSPLIDALQINDPFVRRCAAGVLSEAASAAGADEAGATEALEAALDDEDAGVRFAAAAALEHLRG